ncbi:MAG: heat-shock protein [Alphaproteobacteria bacterium]|nr:MAG: heat-shock protein [Alphaproteobacteria bacterium]
MRSFDLTPLYRSTVGFDRFASLLDTVLSNAQATETGYPPYNIEKTGDDAYRITVAVAGFSDDELSVESRDNVLIISGRKEAKEEDESRYLHRGIATRAFERRFQLADYVRAESARTENGLLHVDLVREVPEALKPRKIEIAHGPMIESAVEGKKAKARAH